MKYMNGGFYRRVAGLELDVIGQVYIETKDGSGK